MGVQVVYGVIYQVTNRVNGKFYIGQTIMRINNRWSKHKGDARAGKGWVMAAAIRKYGEDAFDVEVLSGHDSKEELNAEEYRLIQLLKPEYNSMGGGNALGSPSAEVKAKISAASKGRKITEAARERMRAAQKGKRHSPETVERIREALAPRYEAMRQARFAKYGPRMRPLRKRVYASPLEDYYKEVGAVTKNEKIAAAAKLGFASGKRERLSGAKNAMYGREVPQEERERRSKQFSGEKNPYYGESHSEEARAKMSLAHKNRAPVTCPHCGKTGALNAMRRWHFDRCRSK